MTSNLTGAAGHRDAVRFTMRAATVRHDGTTMPIHLVATSERSALAYGAERLRVGAPIVLIVDAVELGARVGWSDGRRFRLDAELGDDGRLWALLDRAPGDEAGRGNAADNDGGPAGQFAHSGPAGEHIAQAA